MSGNEPYVRSSRINIHFKHYNRNAPHSSDALLEQKKRSLYLLLWEFTQPVPFGVEALWAWSVD